MAADISLVRIDDRLIHGQVVTAWLKSFPSDAILVVDDSVATDDLMKRVLRAAAPKGSTVIALTVDDAVAYLSDEAHDGQEVMIISRGPEAIERLIDGGIAIESVILGGMGLRADRMRLNRNISATEDEIACMKRLIEKGAEVGYHLVPQESYVPLEKLL